MLFIFLSDFWQNNLYYSTGCLAKFLSNFKIILLLFIVETQATPAGGHHKMFKERSRRKEGDKGGG